MDDEQRYQAAVSKDARFDGVFVTAVTSTGIYCRPSCPAMTPKRANMRFFKTAAAAQEAGFRACKRCRPDASPGSPEWNIRADVTARAMRLIADGRVDRDGVAGLAAALGYEQRQVRRLLTAELGASPLALARAQRAQTARILIETTTLPMGDIAFAAGFASIRQFNATILEVFDLAPTLLRSRAARGASPTARPGVIRVRLPFRPPLDAARLLGYLAARAIPGVEEVKDGTYKRTIQLPNAPGLLSLHLVPPPGRAKSTPRSASRPRSRLSDILASPSDGPRGVRGVVPPGNSSIECDLELDDLRDVAAAVQRCRRLLDLDADPAAITELLSADPVIGPLARACPGRRSPGHVDGSELALRAVLGQQVSVAAARTLGARLTVSYGKPLAAPRGGLTHLFPDATTIAAADPAALPMPRARATALTGLAAALASGDVTLHPGADWEQSTERLLALPGIGPWTASYIRMRALSDPDVFLPTDVGVRSACARWQEPPPYRARTERVSPGGTTPSGSDRSAYPGDTPGPPTPRRRPTATQVAALAESWRPWRSYALHHLWATLEQPLPEEAPTP